MVIKYKVWNKNAIIIYNANSSIQDMLSIGVISDVTVPDVVSVLNFLIFISFCSFSLTKKNSCLILYPMKLGDCPEEEEEKNRISAINDVFIERTSTKKSPV